MKFVEAKRRSARTSLRSAFRLVLVSLPLAAGCDDSYLFPIVELELSQHAETPILGTWRVEELLGERAEPGNVSDARFESDPAGRLWLSFSSTPEHRSPCAALRDGRDVLLSCAVGPSAAEGGWILVKARFVSSGEVLEIYHPRADLLRSAIRGGTLLGRLDTFEIPGDLIEVEASPVLLREFFVGNEPVFHGRPAVVLSRDWQPSANTSRRAPAEREADQRPSEPDGPPTEGEETRE
jgi:hypothetical protein